MTARSLVAALLVALLATSEAEAQCACDCDGDGQVQVPEVVLGIGIVLGSQSPSACPSLQQCDAGGGACEPGIETLVMCVQDMLNGCPSIGVTPDSTPTATPTIPQSSPPPTPTPTCTPRECGVTSCTPPLVLFRPAPCGCPVCATPTRTPTRTQTPTTTACRNVPPAAAPVTSPTELLSQDIFFCGIERSVSTVYLLGARTSRNERRLLSYQECPIQCPYGTQQCYAEPVLLDPNRTHHIIVVQNRGICGGTLSVDEDVFGNPLTIRQISLP